MLKQLINECRIRLQLEARDPLLIKAGLSNSRDIDSAFVRTTRDGEEQIYLPGTSLKGVLRSQCERIARTLNDAAACDPLARGGPLRSCGDVFEEREHPRSGTQRPSGAAQAPATVYRESCPICKIFGSGALGSRVSISDGYMVAPSQPVLSRRDGIGIDRFTGGAAPRVSYEMEVATEVTFAADIVLRNFELAQLGLLGLALRDLLEGELRIGSGRSRGLGRLRGQIVSCDVSTIGRQDDVVPALVGVGNGLRGGGAYGLPADDLLSVDGATYEPVGIRTYLRVPSEAFPWDALYRRAEETLTAYAPAPSMLRARQPGTNAGTAQSGGPPNQMRAAREHAAALVRGGRPPQQPQAPDVRRRAVNVPDPDVRTAAPHEDTPGEQARGEHVADVPTEQTGTGVGVEAPTTEAADITSIADLPTSSPDEGNTP